MSLPNLIIVSDLHLGDRETMSRNLASGAHRADEFPAVLEYYLDHPIADRPWRLVIAGDFADFDEVTALPDTADLARAGVALDRDRQKFGLGAGPWESAWKLTRIIEDNQAIFRSLARFVLAGNELYLIPGNHDAPFFWPEVQDQLRRSLAELSGKRSELEAAARAMQERVRFHPWFYCEPSELWVEHGHQYDPLNSFEYIAAPIHPWKNEIAPTSGGLGQRYMTNRMTNVNPYAENTVGFFKYLRWAIRTQGLAAFRVVGYFVEAAVRILFMSGRLRRRRLYRLQLKTELFWERESGISRLILRRLRRIQERPLMRSWRLTAAGIHLDKVLVLLVYLGVLVAVVGLPLSFLGKLVAVGVLASSFYGAIELISAGHERRGRRSFFRKGAQVAGIAGVRHVVMGHMHEPYLGHVDERIRVYGLGAWVSNQGGIADELASAVIPSFAVVSGEQGQRRVVIYAWDRKTKKPIDGRELSRLEVLAV